MAVGNAEAETLMEAVERQILQIQYARSLREPPWDGQSSHKAFIHLAQPPCLSTL